MYKLYCRMVKALMHFIFWSIFFFMWNRIMYFYIDNDLNRLYFSVVDVSLVVIAFYVVYLSIMPDYFRRKNIVRLVLSLSALTIVLWFIYSWISQLFLLKNLVPIHFSFSWNYKDLQYNRFFIALLGVSAGCFVKLAMDRMEVSKRMEQLEKEKSVAELTYLKAQINPHFLFNSLNNLYAQMETEPADAKNTLTSLADMLRYQLYDCSADFIPVEKEIAYLENYFKLQSIRNENSTASLLIEKPDKNLLVAPLLLIPFVENAFKYVSDHNDGQNFVRAGLNFEKNRLRFYCVNSIEHTTEIKDDKEKGIGYANVRKRLELIYGNNFELKTTMDDKQYAVVLSLILK